MKLRIKTLALIWNAVHDMEAINEPVTMTSYLTGWIKRFKVLARPEVRIWFHEWSDAERMAFSDYEVTLDIKKIPKGDRPNNIPIDYADALQEVFHGKLEVEEPQLRQLMKAKMKEESNEQ